MRLTHAVLASMVAVAAAACTPSDLQTLAGESYIVTGPQGVDYDARLAAVRAAHVHVYDGEEDHHWSAGDRVEAPALSLFVRPVHADQGLPFREMTIWQLPRNTDLEAGIGGTTIDFSGTLLRLGNAPHDGAQMFRSSNHGEEFFTVSSWIVAVTEPEAAGPDRLCFIGSDHVRPWSSHHAAFDLPARCLEILSVGNGQLVLDLGSQVAVGTMHGKGTDPFGFDAIRPLLREAVTD